MNTQAARRASVIALAGAVALGTMTPTGAAATSSRSALVKAATLSAISNVRYRTDRGPLHHDKGAGVTPDMLGRTAAPTGDAAYGHGYDDDTQGDFRQYSDDPYYPYGRGPGNRRSNALYGHDSNY